MMYSNYYFPYPKTFRVKSNCAVDYKPAVDQSIRPKMNAYEKDEQLIIEFSMPGVLKEDASIQLENKLLHLNAKRIQKSEDAKSLHKEFADVSYKRSIQLPEDIDTESLKARFENGVLYVQMNRIKKVTHSISVN
ncbi:MAG: Hsp20/alpha crystallin family protein [Saprospiraceae bacterium]|nr:Hsp20/alpha crystallin family protein [Saprospiraceae bacterium]MBK8297313.1 Hsp20/alpha crystallin family protein [Saprospiraceae bacterium]